MEVLVFITVILGSLALGVAVGYVVGWLVTIPLRRQTKRIVELSRQLQQDVAVDSDGRVFRAGE